MNLCFRFWLIGKVVLIRVVSQMHLSLGQRLDVILEIGLCNKWCSEFIWSCEWDYAFLVSFSYEKNIFENYLNPFDEMLHLKIHGCDGINHPMVIYEPMSIILLENHFII